MDKRNYNVITKHNYDNFYHFIYKLTNLFISLLEQRPKEIKVGFFLSIFFQ